MARPLAQREGLTQLISKGEARYFSYRPLAARLFEQIIAQVGSSEVPGHRQNLLFLSSARKAALGPLRAVVQIADLLFVAYNDECSLESGRIIMFVRLER